MNHLAILEENNMHTYITYERMNLTQDKHNCTGFIKNTNYVYVPVEAH